MFAESQRLEAKIKDLEVQLSKLPKGKLLCVHNGNYHKCNFVCSVKHKLIFCCVYSLFLIPDGVGISLKVDCTACVLPTFQNFNYGIAVPTARVLRQRIRTVDTFAVFIGSGSQYPIFSQLIGNL